MKTLLILVLAGSVAAVGGAFFGVWTIPGLEKLPTVESMGKSREGAIEREAERRLTEDGAGDRSGPWGNNSGGSLGTRARQVRDSETDLEN